MILVDTSIWIEHLRSGNLYLKSALEEGEVVCHPFIIGELACGDLKNRDEILSLMQALPMALTIGHDEILHFIDYNSLMAIGIGLIDVHLLASARLTQIPLWTADKRLSAAASKLKVSY